MSKISTRSKTFALLTVAAIALAACGGSSETSSSSSTAAIRTKNGIIGKIKDKVKNPIPGSTVAPTTTIAPTTTTTTTTVARTTTTTRLTCATGGTCGLTDIGPGGGKVFYTAPTRFTSTGSACGSSCRYLEVAPVGWIVAATPAGQANCRTSGYSNTAGTSTKDPNCAWSRNTTTRIGTTSTAIGAGYANTSAMIAQNNVGGAAATVARAFLGGGKTDWHLASKDEMEQLYNQRSRIGGLAEYPYWTSSEFNATGAWPQSFSYGYHDLDGLKTNHNFVRPVRAF